MEWIQITVFLSQILIGGAPTSVIRRAAQLAENEKKKKEDAEKADAAAKAKLRLEKDAVKILNPQKAAEAERPSTTGTEGPAEP